MPQNAPYHALYGLMKKCNHCYNSGYYYYTHLYIL